jgi:cytochrome c-type biogenesis protein CcmE
MSRKRTYLLGGVLLVALAGYSLYSFAGALNSQVSFQQARVTDRTVQVAGGLEKGSSDYDMADDNLRFTLLEDGTGETVRVRYQGLKPANFEDAISIVAIGQWDAASEEFAAHTLLVKCPSKYQGAEVKEYS